MLQGQERSITLSPLQAQTETIGNVKRRAFQKEIVADEAQVRFIYQGKLLQDAAKVSEQNFKVNPFIHVIINKKDKTYSNLERNNQANINAVSNLRQQLLDEIDLNLRGTHLGAGERRNMTETR